MKNTQRIFNNYQKLLVPLFEAFGEFESQVSHLQLNSEGRQVKHEITLDPACEANGWKFTMNLSYDLSENKNYEAPLTNHSFRCRTYSFAFRVNSVYLAFFHS